MSWRMTPPPRRLYFRGARLLTFAGNGQGDGQIDDGALLIQDGRIAAAGRAGDVPCPPDAVVAAYDGCTILPGLIDAHVHLMYRAGETIHDHARRFDDHDLLVRSAHHARLLVEAGVTTVRDCGSRGTFLQSLREGIRTGLLPGPRLLVSGPPVTTTAGHLWVCGGEVDSAEAGRALVRRLVKEDVDFIKVMATGGRMTPGSIPGRAQFTVDELRAIADDAHRLGRRVAAHCLGTEGLAAAVEAGIDTIEHGAWLDESGEGYAFDESVARRMAEQGTYLNLAAQPSRGLAEQPKAQPLNEAERRQLARLQQRWHLFRRGIDLGVRSFISTDSIYGQWPDSCVNLSWLTTLMVERAGLAPLDALRMVTATPAEACGLADEVGSLAPGRVADLLIVRGDPVASIRDLHDVVAVYRSGQLAAGSAADSVRSEG